MKIDTSTEAVEALAGLYDHKITQGVTVGDYIRTLAAERDALREAIRRNCYECINTRDIA